jgi:hypothetical protein
LCLPEVDDPPHILVLRQGVYRRRLIPVKHTYPVRLSTDELRQELDAYLATRQLAEKAPKTIDLDKRKVLYFLDWLDSGDSADDQVPFAGA